MIEQKLKALKLIADRFAHTGVEFTLGGSCLLYAHGLIPTFNDIDFLTEDREDKIVSALRGIELKRIPSSNIYSSDFFYKFHFEGTDFDLMGNFHIQGPEGKVKIHSIPSGHWNGIPLGSLKIWKKAYLLMGRPDSAALIP